MSAISAELFGFYLCIQVKILRALQDRFYSCLENRIAEILNSRKYCQKRLRGINLS